MTSSLLRTFVDNDPAFELLKPKCLAIFGYNSLNRIEKFVFHQFKSEINVYECSATWASHPVIASSDRGIFYFLFQSLVSVLSLSFLSGPKWNVKISATFINQHCAYWLVFSIDYSTPSTWLFYKVQRDRCCTGLFNRMESNHFLEIFELVIPCGGVREIGNIGVPKPRDECYK